MFPSMDRRAAIAGVAVATIISGGVAQAYLWRWNLTTLGVVLGSQFAWMLVIFAASWLLAQGRTGVGMTAGGLTGLGLISNYYLFQWLADGWRSASDQFLDSKGWAWLLATTFGGAVIGIFGALASRDPRSGQAKSAAVGIITPAAMLVLGPVGWLAVSGDLLRGSSLTVATVVYVLVALGLAACAVRSCGRSAVIRAIGVALLLAIAALGSLYLLQISGILYLTF